MIANAKSLANIKSGFDHQRMDYYSKVPGTTKSGPPGKRTALYKSQNGLTANHCEIDYAVVA